MRNIHLIPTDKPSRLYKHNELGFKLLAPVQHEIGAYNGSNQHIYITSDEEIKDVRPYKGKWQLEQGEILNKFPTYLTDLSECKLVIMTTDQDLIADGVQAIDDEFLEWFVKNPSCEEVEVQDWVNFYKVFIPQEEPKQDCTCGVCNYCEEQETIQILKEAKENALKQKTLEEAAANLADPNICKTDNWIAGAKWMAENMPIHILDVENTYVHIEDGVIVVEKNDKTETMYTEDEVIRIARDAYAMGRNIVLVGAFNKWLEKFKKK